MNYSIDTTKYINDMIASCAKCGVIINLRNPKTIQDKLAWLNIYDINPLKTKCADKIQVHDYTKEVLGEDICIHILKIYNSTNEIDWNELPDTFVMKCNHGFAMNIIVKDKSKLNKEEAINNLNWWMNTDFSKVYMETHYHDIPHKIFVEQFMNDGHKDLVDYKFLCFNGKPTYIQIIGNRSLPTKYLNYYNMDFEFCDISRKDFPNNKNMHDIKPKNFDLMVEYAKKLSEDFKFVRVDFYEIDGKVYLGEMTFTPGAMHFKYKNPEDHIKIGNLLEI